MAESGAGTISGDKVATLQKNIDATNKNIALAIFPDQGLEFASFSHFLAGLFPSCGGGMDIRCATGAGGIDRAARFEGGLVRSFQSIDL